jgi:hypothetical protein
MTALEIARFLVAALPAALWLVCSFANLYIAALAICNRPSPSPGPVLGSVAGLLAIFIQPVVLGGALPVAFVFAILPDIAWSCGAAFARILDLFRTPRHRFS